MEKEKTDKSIYFMLKENQKGLYVIPVSATGQEIKNIENWMIEDEWFSLPESYRDILNFINKSKKKEIYGDWDNIWGDFQETHSSEETYIKEEGELTELLLESGILVTEDFLPLQYIPLGNSLSLEIIESQENPERFQSHFLLNGLYSDLLFIDNKFVYYQNTFYRLDILEDSLHDLESFVSELGKERLEHFLTLFSNCFRNIEVNCMDYSVERRGEKNLVPQLVIEKISKDMSLYLKILISVSSMDYSFLKEHFITTVAMVNQLEKKIVIAPLNFESGEAAADEIVKALTKLRKNLLGKNSYYMDEDHLLIIQEDLAKEFIGKELLKLASKYKVIGTEKLKSYNIRSLTPKLVGSFKHGIDFFEGDVDIEIEGEKFSIRDVLNTYRRDSYIVLSDGTNALIDHKYIEKLERIFQNGDSEKKIKISFFDLPIIEDMIDEKIYSEEFKGSRNFFKGINSISDFQVKIPEIKATLREYQIYGFKWLNYVIKSKLGCCLADDMGLGKTLQAIALLSSLHEEKEGTSLVVMPKSLIYNWENELNKFNPSLKTAIYYGNNRDLGILEDADVVITTYGTVRNDIEKLRDFNFKLIILDESQNIKNVNAQTTKAVMLLNSEYRLALSGTPIENNLTELYSLFRFLNPGMFGSLEEFNSNYAVPIQKENDQSAVLELRKKIYPFILRRIKKEVLKDLPEKIEQTMFIEMNSEHKKFYEERRAHYFNMINQSIKEQGIGKSQFFIFQALNELRMITSCPESKGEHVISSKREMLINSINDAVANGHKVLVFTNYLVSVENICKDLKNLGIKHLSMTGATKNRQELVDRFQMEPSYKVFVMTLKSGGVGLNLTSADTIFIYDPWWNKTAENQATDRAYRLGQDRTVFSYKLILKNTIEEKILKLQEVKSELLDNLISADNSPAKTLTEEDIKFILGGDSF